jgi:nucleotide-binding universal stress UspA family protein
MSNSDIGAIESHSKDRRTAIQRLLFVADAAVADVGELPPAVHTVIDAAADVYVITPTLPGRLAWLADEVDRFRHLADERLDTVLGHMHSIDAHVSGIAIRGSVLTVIADAVAEFKPDHMLIALRSSEHANWQERKLIAHIEERFGLPLTTYAVVEIADREDAATIVMGSRGLTGLRAMLLGSVSSAVVHHADRPTLIIRQPVAAA